LCPPTAVSMHPMLPPGAGGMQPPMFPPPPMMCPPPPSYPTAPTACMPPATVTYPAPPMTPVCPVHCEVAPGTVPATPHAATGSLRISHTPHGICVSGAFFDARCDRITVQDHPHCI